MRRQGFVGLCKACSGIVNAGCSNGVRGGMHFPKGYLVRTKLRTRDLMVIYFDREGSGLRSYLDLASARYL
jgi:hypothetical protein